MQFVRQVSVGKNEASSLKVGDGDMSSFVGMKSVVGVCVTEHKCRLCSESVRAVVDDFEELSFGIG